MRKHCSIPFISMMAICAEQKLPKIIAISGVATVTPMTHKCRCSQWEKIKSARTCRNRSSTSIGTFYPDGDGYVDVSGGFHDAGDHVKFGMPENYAASTLGWGYYEFRDAYVDSGQQWHIEDILHWFNDYYLKCTYFDENGDILAFCYQVGEGDIDHNYWNAPELQNESLLDFARPAYFATVETPASDMCAGVAASLAVNYLNFKDTEPEYAKRCLNTAVKMYEFAVKTHSEAEDGKTVTSLGYDGGFYTSSYDYDELAWAAVWLYECTGEYDHYCR